MKNISSLFNDSETNYRWNNEVIEKLIPIYIVLLIYLVVGISGNSLVLFIYLRRFKNYSEGRFFIPVLAATDMLSCVVSSGGHISETMLEIVYRIDIVCKIERYLRMITTAFAMFTLVLIVIDRYLKICRPFGWQMTKRWKKLFFLIVIIAGFVVSLPCFIFYGSAPITSEDGTVIGQRCNGVTGGFPALALAFNISLFSIAFLELVLLAVLYFLICRVVFKKMKFRKQMKTKKIAEVTEETERPPTTSDIHFESSVPELSFDRICVESNRTVSFKEINPSNRDAANSRVTSIFLVITIAFGISFIPTIATMVLESTDINFWFTLSDQELVGIMFLYTFYIFNNFLNPFVYGFMDEKFQFELKHLCCMEKQGREETRNNDQSITLTSIR